ncbi:Fe2+-dependent dioxygenase [Pandoraea sputorum]|uniref:Fe2+-dependent dioxygenase n=1 Tax=Pandoraea sputorum TaxID=93222 RepID=A0A5E5AWD7_9BURK|nr:hypothetical protein [Pandoraea sputorum]VVE77784.1 Fe2+-dependent dioxygenase [Pandoraea sputorum]
MDIERYLRTGDRQVQFGAQPAAGAVREDQRTIVRLCDGAGDGQTETGTDRTESLVQLTGSYHNLLRMWADV